MRVSGVGRCVGGSLVATARMRASHWSGSRRRRSSNDAKGYIRGATPNSNSPIDPYARFSGQRFGIVTRLSAAADEISARLAPT
jgi:hypothetical protein